MLGLFFLDMNKDFKEFRARNDKGLDVYPDTPPEWCPLRQQEITIKLIDADSHDHDAAREK